MTQTALFIIAAVADLAGFVLTAYGLLRESFANLAATRPFGEGRYGEGPYGGVPSPASRGLVAFATRIRLLPGDRQLTIEDRRKNASAAIAGVLLLLVGFGVGKASAALDMLSPSAQAIPQSTASSSNTPTARLSNGDSVAALDVLSPSAQAVPQSTALSSKTLTARLSNGDSVTLRILFKPGACLGGTDNIDCYLYHLTAATQQAATSRPSAPCPYIDLKLLDRDGFSVYSARGTTLTPGWNDNPDAIVRTDTLREWRGRIPEPLLPRRRFDELVTLQADCARH